MLRRQAAGEQMRMINGCRLNMYVCEGMRVQRVSVCVMTWRVLPGRVPMRVMLCESLYIALHRITACNASYVLYHMSYVIYHVPYTITYDAASLIHHNIACHMNVSCDI